MNTVLRHITHINILLWKAINKTDILVLSNIGVI